MSFWQQVIDGIEIVTMEVILAVAPIVILFVLMNIISFRMRKKRFFDIMKGFLITTIGLILFLHGVNMAYVPVGQHLGSAIAGLPYNYILVPLGFLMGFLVGFAEPAIHVMIKQVEELSEGENPIENHADGNFNWDRRSSRIVYVAFARRILSLLFLDPRIRASIYFRTKSGQDLFSNGF